jgi:Group II intron, maturase-specific domain
LIVKGVTAVGELLPGRHRQQGVSGDRQLRRYAVAPVVALQAQGQATQGRGIPPRSKRSDAAALHAQAQKADGPGAGAQRGVSPTPIATDWKGDSPDQSGATGWVNYFAVGHSSECFSFIKDWVEKKVRRHLAHAQKRKGFGWERWNRQWLYDTLKLFNAYRVRRDGPKVVPAG